MTQPLLDLEQIHERELKCLAFLDRICREHDLRYSLAYGTLLGAIRHQGFIPWDDDADVMMPAADYAKLVSLFASGRVKDTDFRFFTPALDRHYYYTIGRLADTHSRIAPTNGDREIPGLGVFIDIYPFYYAFDDPSLHGLVYSEEIVSQYERDQVAYSLRKLYSALKIAASLFYGANNSGWMPRASMNGLSQGGKLKLVRLLKKVYRLAGSRWAYWLYLALLARLPRQSPIYYDPHSMTFFETGLFENLMDVEFAGRKFLATPLWQRVLVSIYKDYMTPPPSEQRGSRHHYETYAV